MRPSPDDARSSLSIVRDGERLPDDGARLLVVVGASGAGKDSVVDAWLAGLDPRTRPHRARRTITRPADAGGELHEAVSESRFDALLDAGAFALAWSAHGLRYGVRREELAGLATGGRVVVNGSRAHLPTLRRVAPACRVVEITAPESVREARLAGRDRETALDRQARLRREVGVAIEADLRIVNGGALHEAVGALAGWWRRVMQE